MSAALIAHVLKLDAKHRASGLTQSEALELQDLAPQLADFAEAETKRADEAERLLAVAREALDRIKRPIWWMQEDQRRKTGSINGVGHDAARLADNPAFLRGIAESTLAQLPAAPTQPTKQ